MQVAEQLESVTIERLRKQGEFLLRLPGRIRPGPYQPFHGILAQQCDCHATYR